MTKLQSLLAFFKQAGKNSFPPTPSFRRTRAERSEIFLEIGSRYFLNCGHYTKKFGLISSRIPNEARSACAVKQN